MCVACEMQAEMTGMWPVECPVNLQAEMEWRSEEYAIEDQDRMEAQGGPVFSLWIAEMTEDGEIPF